MAHVREGVTLEATYRIGDPPVRDYSFGFPVGRAQDVAVELDGEAVNEVQYRVQVSPQRTGGSVRLLTTADGIEAPAVLQVRAGQQLRIYRDTTAERRSTFTGGGYVQASAVEALAEHMHRVLEELVERQETHRTILEGVERIDYGELSADLATAIRDAAIYDSVEFDPNGNLLRLTNSAPLIADPRAGEVQVHEVDLSHLADLDTDAVNALIAAVTDPISAKADDPTAGLNLVAPGTTNVDLSRPGGMLRAEYTGSGQSEGRSGFIETARPAADVDFTTPSAPNTGDWTGYQTIMTLPAVTAEQAGFVLLESHLHAENPGPTFATSGGQRLTFEVRLRRTRGAQTTTLVEHGEYGPRNLNGTTDFFISTREADDGLLYAEEAEEGDVYFIEARASSQTDGWVLRFTMPDNYLQLVAVGGAASASGYSDARADLRVVSPDNAATMTKRGNVELATLDEGSMDTLPGYRTNAMTGRTTRRAIDTRVRTYIPAAGAGDAGEPLVAVAPAGSPPVAQPPRYAPVAADKVAVEASGFGINLQTTDRTAQQIFERLNQLDLGGDADQLDPVTALPAGVALGTVVTFSDQLWRYVAGDTDRHVYHGTCRVIAGSLIGDDTFQWDDDTENVRFEPLKTDIGTVRANLPNQIWLEVSMPGRDGLYDLTSVTLNAVQNDPARWIYLKTAGDPAIDSTPTSVYAGRAFSISAYTDAARTTPVNILASSNRWVPAGDPSGGLEPFALAGSDARVPWQKATLRDTERTEGFGGVARVTPAANTADFVITEEMVDQYAGLRLSGAFTSGAPTDSDRYVISFPHTRLGIPFTIVNASAYDDVWIMTAGRLANSGRGFGQLDRQLTAAKLADNFRGIIIAFDQQRLGAFVSESKSRTAYQAAIDANQAAKFWTGTSTELSAIQRQAGVWYATTD